MDRLTPVDIRELAKICPCGLEVNADLSRISHWRIGGIADLIIRPSTTLELVNLRQWFIKRSIRPVVIGLTSNLLFDDSGLRVPCIQIGSMMSHTRIETKKNIIDAQAGIWVPRLAGFVMRAGLGGAEHICGIPGTLGGLICMNGGSQRKNIGSSIVEVESVDSNGDIVTRTAPECGFSYRQSIFQDNEEIITSAKMLFTPAPKIKVRAEMLSILAERRRKFPRKQPNCGSVFKSNPEMYSDIGSPGAAIERMGLKGLRVGGAMISPCHANFIVNAGGATSQDVRALIAIMRDAVERATGYVMATEAHYVGVDGTKHSADVNSTDSVSYA